MAFVVAEVGCNHKGDMAIARQMIETAARVCGAAVVKFQKRDLRSLLTPAQYDAPHPDPRQAYGPSYGRHREALEFTLDDHRGLQAACTAAGVVYTSSVWDIVSAREIASLCPPFIKVPSAANLNWPMLSALLEAHPGEIHLSLGMTTRDEEDAILAFFEARGRAGDLVIYACTSAYPTSAEQICLGEITRLRSRFAGRVKAIGFSGHHLGTAPDIAALALGATWFERHFTLDRSWKGTDHAISLEPDGLRRLVQDLDEVSRALGSKPATMLETEQAQRRKQKWEPAEHG